MKKVSCSVEGNLGILKNQIYESQLDIEWLIKEIPHIKDPKLLHEVKRWLGKRQIGSLSVKDTGKSE
jgi:hypothetical protein